MSNIPSAPGALPLPQQLTQWLAGLSSASPMPCQATMNEGHKQLRCELTAVDSLACAFTDLAVASDHLAQATPDQLAARAQQLSARLTYLLEPIRPIELDAEQCVVQLRSSPPQQGEGQTSYYELIVRKGGEACLCRYEKSPGQVRQVCPAHVTRQVLVRLVGDLGAAVE